MKARRSAGVIREVCGAAVTIANVMARSIDMFDRRSVALAASAAMILLPLLFVLAIPDPLEQPLGVDVTLYRDVAARWLDSGAFYEPRQLAGPYEVAHGDVLYPPVGLWLFVPFTVLPLVLWWAIPAALTAWAIWQVRPRPAVWPLMALCLAWPTTPLKIWTGNPVIWCLAAMSVAIVFRWAAPFVLLKPSLFPFALFGVRERAWWIGLGVLVLLCLPFGGLWADWLASVLNSRGSGLLYSALEAPMLLLPIAAWLGRTRALHDASP
jgi:hypothetical protein